MCNPLFLDYMKFTIIPTTYISIQIIEILSYFHGGGCFLLFFNYYNVIRVIDIKKYLNKFDKLKHKLNFNFIYDELLNEADKISSNYHII